MRRLRYTGDVFTGIVQAVVKVQAQKASRLSLDLPPAPDDPWALGESVAVNGCCLTLVAWKKGLEFDLSQETLTRTTLGSLSQGQLVNLERALKAGDRLGGHIVQGHVDTTGEFRDWEDSNLAFFSVDESWSRHLVDKGSVTIDGVSLTVVQPEGGRFKVAFVPHTLENTTLGGLQSRQRVNIEFDVLAKYALNRQ